MNEAQYHEFIDALIDGETADFNNGKKIHLILMGVLPIESWPHAGVKLYVMAP